MPQNSAGVDWHAQVASANENAGRITVSLVRHYGDGNHFDTDDATRDLLWKIVNGCEPWFLIDKLPYVDGNKVKVELVLKEGVE